MPKKPPAKKREFFNKKARFEYEILESLEAGIVLFGPEIKAVRAGRVNLTGSYGKIINGEIFWIGGTFNTEAEPQRTRKLLLKKEQIGRLAEKLTKGLTLIPLKLYLARGKAKLELGLGRGLKKYDKRAKLKEKDQKREISRKIKGL